MTYSHATSQSASLSCNYAGSSFLCIGDADCDISTALTFQRSENGKVQRPLGRLPRTPGIDSWHSWPHSLPTQLTTQLTTQRTYTAYLHSWQHSWPHSWPRSWLYSWPRSWLYSWHTQLATQWLTQRWPAITSSGPGGYTNIKEHWLWYMLQNYKAVKFLGHPPS